MKKEQKVDLAGREVFHCEKKQLLITTSAHMVFASIQMHVHVHVHVHACIYMYIYMYTPVLINRS